MGDGDGFCGGLGDCDAVDLDGVSHVDLSHADYGDHCGGIDTMDLLGVARDNVSGEHVDADDGSGVMVSSDQNVFAMRIDSHGLANLNDLLAEAIERVGLMKLQAHRVCGRALQDPPVALILPVNAWTGVKKPGRMPSGFRPGMSGRTAMFKLYFQMPTREWGTFSTPQRDREPGGHFEIGGMTWRYDDVGDYESQLICRFHPKEVLAGRDWGVRDSKVRACRVAGYNLVKAVRSRLVHYAPVREAAEARRLLNAPPVVTVRPPVPEIVLDVQPRPRQSGTCLLSALLPVPALATVVATGVDPYAAQVESLVTQPVVAENMVMAKVVLPARRRA